MDRNDSNSKLADEILDTECWSCALEPGSLGDLENESDLDDFIDRLFESTDNGRGSSDPLWENGERLLLKALILLAHDSGDGDAEERALAAWRQFRRGAGKAADGIALALFFRLKGLPKEES